MHILIHEGMVIHKQASYKTALRAFLENWLIMRVAGKQAKKELDLMTEEKLIQYYDDIDLEFEKLLDHAIETPLKKERHKVIEYFNRRRKRVR